MLILSADYYFFGSKNSRKHNKNYIHQKKGQVMLLECELCELHSVVLSPGAVKLVEIVVVVACGAVESWQEFGL